MKETNQSGGLVKISVRNLVEFILRSGDIDNRRSTSADVDAMREGARIHRKIQNRMGPEYAAEVGLKIVIPGERYDMVVEGRADGILEKEGEPVMIDEIKGIYMDLENLKEPVPVHLAQAKCYAYIYARDNGLDTMRIQMTYCNLDTEELKYFTEEESFEELSVWFLGLINEYKKWANFQFAWRQIRQESIKPLEFPYPYRPGQKKLVSDVYRTIHRKKNLFIQAPTGTGKTISAIFPAVKAVGEGLSDKIFYLTAKTITGTVAMDTFGLLTEQGYRAKLIQLTAKEKLCPLEEMECNPVHCPYAKGHFDRVNDAVFELLNKEDTFTREVLLEQAKEHMVCPFEMSLDVASWVDDVVCDYNYAFDPNVFLKRFFADGVGGNYIFLVDEAHNLVERAREMYSADLVKEEFLETRRYMRLHSKKIEKELTRCNKILLEYKRACDECEVMDNTADLVFALMRLSEQIEKFLVKNIEFKEKKEFLEFYFKVRNFIAVYDRVDENYLVYSEHDEEGRFRVKLFCVDPSRNLEQCLEKADSTVFFSATLLPIRYYKSLLSEREDNYAVYADSTFTKEQRLLAVGSDVSSKYTRRTPDEFVKIASYIWKTVEAKKGNYLVFFPSYKMMEQVEEEFSFLAGKKVDCIMQKSGMKEDEREEFLKEFEQERDCSLAAFCVMGGIFGEGIDLTNDRLIGAVIVGTGLPQISHERELLKDFFDKRNHAGFDYAYRFPGMNKVQQAAGRVIRTSEDRGVILLLDERFLQRENLLAFPREWEDFKVVRESNVEEALQEFWEQ